MKTKKTGKMHLASHFELGVGLRLFRQFIMEKFCNDLQEAYSKTSPIMRQAGKVEQEIGKLKMLLDGQVCREDHAFFDPTRIYYGQLSDESLDQLKEVLQREIGNLCLDIKAVRERKEKEVS